MCERKPFSICQDLRIWKIVGLINMSTQSRKIAASSEHEVSGASFHICLIRF